MGVGRVAPSMVPDGVVATTLFEIEIVVMVVALDACCYGFDFYLKPSSRTRT